MGNSHRAKSQAALILLAALATMWAIVFTPDTPTEQPRKLTPPQTVQHTTPDRPTGPPPTTDRRR